uniref:Ig-like domain-containing protein n=1 Tax=Sander lucioperca TaxID=283035 RepID=A0A8C9WXW6_SANLU
MLPLLLHTFTCVCVLTATAVVAAVTTETMVGVAGRRVTLPCRSEAVRGGGVEVCWGRGEPSLFTCHNAVINAAGDQLTYRKSHRYSVSSSSSLSIFPSRPSDSGFYHCRVQLAGLFNDQISSVYLIIINPRSVVSDPSDSEDAAEDAGNLNAPHTPSEYRTHTHTHT